MRIEQNRRLFPGSFDARDQIRAAGIALDDLRIDVRFA